MNTVTDKPKSLQRRLALLFCLSFAVSALFPIVASITNRSGKVLLRVGSVDVGIAFLTFLLFVALTTVAKKPADVVSLSRAQRINEYLVSLPLLLIALYFLGVDVNWEILLIGIGWRLWLLAMAIPYVVAALNKPAEQPVNTES
jgi:hypothetical protein